MIIVPSWGVVDVEQFLELTKLSLRQEQIRTQVFVSKEPTSMRDSLLEGLAYKVVYVLQPSTDLNSCPLGLLDKGLLSRSL